MKSLKFVLLCMESGNGEIGRSGNKMTTGAIARENSFMYVKDWRDARAKYYGSEDKQNSGMIYSSKKWIPPEIGMFKVNVDASWFPGAETISIGMVIRDNKGCFSEGRNLTLQHTEDVLEAESLCEGSSVLGDESCRTEGNSGDRFEVNG